MSYHDRLGRIIPALVGVAGDYLGIIGDIINRLNSKEAAAWYERFKQVLQEGLQKTATAQKFAKWRTFLIGGVDKKSLLQRVKSGFSVGDWAQDLMKNKAFTTLENEESIDTIVLTPKDFGYDRNPTTIELLDPVRLAEWSKQNAERLDGHVVELLPAEAGPHIRDQYKDQPLGEVLWIAMERITASDGRPFVFSVKRLDDGEQWLRTGWARPDAEWPLGSRFVFRLRKVTQA